MKEHHSEAEKQNLKFPQDVTGPQAPDTEEVPVDTAKIQAALEKRADQETAVLPQLTLSEADSSADDSNISLIPKMSQTGHKDPDSGRLARKKRHTSRSFGERWWTPSVRSWFYTFMCMNMPIIGWFYLVHKARYEEDPAQKEFARAYLFYKLVFLIAGAIVLLILICIGLGLLDQLLAYMEMLEKNSNLIQNERPEIRRWRISGPVLFHN